MNVKNALLVETDPRFAKLLTNIGFRVAACGFMDADDVATKAPPEVVILGTDVEPDAARALVDSLVKAHRCATLLVVDAYTPDALSQVLEAGVDAFVQVGVSDSEFVRVVQREVAARNNRTERPLKVPAMVGTSAPMQDLCNVLARTAPSDLPVLITGESGTGKELVAKSIHRLSPRRSHPFVAVNCGAIPENLIESELFGHEKGAFTGATELRRGKFEVANGGTLFLDEIGELPLQMQVKLLRVLEEHAFDRVGGTRQLDVDVRLVCATNRDLAEEVKAGRFREDLFYRIDVLRIETPPLRRRASDIQMLWEHFVAKAAKAEGREALQTRPDVVRMLTQYQWPGNVRELENVARQAVIRRTSGRITPRIVRDRLKVQQQEEDRPDPAALRSLEEIERDAIVRTYHAVSSVKEAAEILGVSERKLYYRLKQYREQGWLPSENATGDRFRLLFAHADRKTWATAEAALQAKFQTTWVPDGMQLLHSVAQAQPDALVVQAGLPVLDGINVLELGFEHGWDFPVVLLGETSDTATRDYAEALGAAAYLEGQLDAAQLRWVLETALTVTVA